MTGIPPQKGYSPDNPFAQPAQDYSADNPFVQKKSPDNPFVEGSQGSLEHILETGKGFLKSTFDDAALAIEALGSYQPNEAKIRLANRLRQQQETAAQAAPIFRENLTKFFDTFSKEQFNKVINDLDLGVNPNASTGEILAKPFKIAGRALAPFGKFSTYGNLASGVVDMLTNPMELMLDEKFSQNGRPLTPQESAEQAQRLLGDATMVLVTHNVSGAINRGLVGKSFTTAAQEGIEGYSSEQLLKLAQGPKVGELGRKVIANTTGGLVGGIAGGSISQSGKDNSLEGVLLNGIMAVPLGFAQEYAANAIRSLRGKVLDTPEEVQMVAKSIFDERQLKIYQDDSIESTMNKLEALKTSDNINEAATKLEVAKSDLGPISEAQFEQEMSDITPKTVPVDAEAAARARVEAARTTPFPTVASNLEAFKQNTYNNFKEFAFKTTQALDAQLPEGWDFDKELIKYMNLKKIPPENLGAIRTDMLQRLKGEYLNSLDKNERAALNKLQFDLNRGNAALQNEFVERANYANKRAQDAGMYVDRDGNGKLVLKSRETGQTIMDLRDHINLMDGFVAGSGKPKGYSLGNGLDEATPIKPPPNNPLPTGPDGAAFSPRYNRSENLMDVVNVSKFGSGFTVVKDVLSSLDNLNQTAFVPIWDKTQVAYRQLLYNLTPFLEGLNKLVKRGAGLTNEEWMHVSRLRYQESAADLVNKFNKDRGVSPLEQDHGKWLADNNIDISRVSEYRRAVEKLDRTELTDAERGQAITDLQAKLGMDSDHLQAYTRFKTILSGDRNTSDLGAVIAYANALKSGKTRAEYIKENNLSPRVIDMAERLDKYYDTLAGQVGIGSRQELERRILQFQKHGVFPPFEDSSPNPGDNLIGKMSTAGEIAKYEDHPITLAQRIATAGIKESQFNPVIEQAKLDAEKQLQNLPRTKRENARLQINDYLAGISGNRKFISDATLEYIAEAMSRRGKELDAKDVQNAARRWMSNYFGTAEASAQGFRPSQGLRDFYSTNTNYYIRFGSKRAARALKLFASMTKEQIDALEMAGEIGTLRPFEVVVPGENASSFRGQAARGTEKLIEASFSGSFQKRAYRNGHAMAYNESYINTMENLSKLMEGKITKEEAYNNMDLHTYDPGIQVQFDKMISTGKDTKLAAAYLARLTAAETVFLYGAANQARFMAGLPGALAGQYTTWSTWESRFATRMLTRGNVKQRIGAATRWATSQALLAAADGLTGFNLSSWFMTPANILPKPGPTVQAFFNLQDATSANQRTQNEALNQLGRQAQLLIPGYQFGRGWAQAYDLWERGFDPVTGLGRGLGVPVDEQNTNWWDVVLREGEFNPKIPFTDETVTIPVPSLGFDKGRQTIPSQILGNEVEKKPSNAGRKAVNQQ